jgi:hypothetical protein
MEVSHSLVWRDTLFGLVIPFQRFPRVLRVSDSRGRRVSLASDDHHHKNQFAFTDMYTQNRPLFDTAATVRLHSKA